MARAEVLVTSRSASRGSTHVVRGTRRRLATAVLVLALPASACSGGGGGDDENAGSTTSFSLLFDPPASTQPPQKISEGTAACGLLNRGEIQTALGRSVKAGAGTKVGNGSSCIWEVGTGTDQVRLAVAPSNPAAFREILSRFSNPVERLNLGDGAFVAGGTGYGLKGSTLVLVIVRVDPPSAQHAAAVKQLLQQAVNRAT